MTKNAHGANRRVKPRTKGYDMLHCQCPLPGLGAEPDLAFETMSFERCLRHYVILADGSLATAEWVGTEYVHTPVPFSGVVVFYSSWPSGYRGLRSVEFCARFSAGQLVGSVACTGRSKA